MLLEWFVMSKKYQTGKQHSSSKPEKVHHDSTKYIGVPNIVFPNKSMVDVTDVTTEQRYVNHSQIKHKFSNCRCLPVLYTSVENKMR